MIAHVSASIKKNYDDQWEIPRFYSKIWLPNLNAETWRGGGGVGNGRNPHFHENGTGVWQFFVTELMREIPSCAPKAHFNSSLGQRPGSAKGAFQFQPWATPKGYPESKTKALKARLSLGLDAGG
jgi:hypothetical protein